MWEASAVPSAQRCEIERKRERERERERERIEKRSVGFKHS